MPKDTEGTSPVEVSQKEGRSAVPRKPVSDVYRSAEGLSLTEETGGDTIYGHFSLFEDPYEINSMWEGRFIEVIKRGAFAETLVDNAQNIRLLYEHGYDPSIGNKPLGKFTKLEEDSRGGYYEAKLYDVDYVNQLRPALADGQLGASFRFRVIQDSWDENPGKSDSNPEGLPVRTITKVKIMELGPVTFGANPKATASVRSLTDEYTKDLQREQLLASTRHLHEETDNDQQVEVEPKSAPAAEISDESEVRQEEQSTEESQAVEPEQRSEEDVNNESGEETRNEDSAPDETSNQKGQTNMYKSVEERRARMIEIETRQAELDAAAGENVLEGEERSENEALEAEYNQLAAEVAEVEARRARVAERHTAGKVDRPKGGAQVTEPETYRKGGKNSYFRDLYRATHKSDYDAAERLQRNDSEVRAGVTTVDGAGGEFVPPLWMIQNFVELARAGRVTADQLAKEQLPSNTDSISLPRVATGPDVAEQLPADQNTAIQETDATTNSVTAAVATIAGGQTISVQNLEQSPVNMDGILLRELAKDYAVKLDTFVLNNNASNKVGLLHVTGRHEVTYTDASPTVGGLYPKVADAIQRIHTNRFDSPDRIVMHPRRWAWLTAALDEQGRPLVVPAAQAPQNVIAMAGGVSAQGFVGSMQGLPVFVDPNITTTHGAGTNQDRILVFKSDDSILFEGTPRAEAFRETKANTLSVYLRFYNYAALHASRYPASISVIDGTGLAAPSFA